MGAPHALLALPVNTLTQLVLLHVLAVRLVPSLQQVEAHHVAYALLVNSRALQEQLVAVIAIQGHLVLRLEAQLVQSVLLGNSQVH